MVSLIRREETILWAHAILTEENFNIVASEQDTLDLLMLMLTLFVVGQARQHTGGQGLKKRTHSSGRCTLLGGAEPQRRQLCTLLGEALLAVDRTKTINKLTPNGGHSSAEWNHAFQRSSHIIVVRIRVDVSKEEGCKQKAVELSMQVTGRLNHARLNFCRNMM